MTRQRRELELELAEEAERALRADEQVRHVERAARDHVEVVAGDAPLDVRHARRDLVALALVDRSHDRGEPVVSGTRGGGRLRVGGRAVVGHVAERHGLAAREPRLGREHVVHHVAVAQRASAAAVVGGHAAERRLRRRRHVDGVPEPVRLQACIEVIEHEAGLDPGRARVDVDLEHISQVLARVEHERRADGLPALRRARAARQNRDLRLGRDLERAHGVSRGPRHDDAEWLDLVNRRVGRVAAAVVGAEQHVAFDLAAEPRLQGGEV